MKTVFIAVAVLSFTSVCWSAPLACNSLVQEVDQSPDLSGRWHLIALAFDMCLLSPLLKLAHPSTIADFIQEGTPNVYDLVFTVKMYGFCANDSQTLMHSNSRLMTYDKRTQETTVTDSLLQTSCPDCFIGKTLNYVNILFFFSRRQRVNDDELNEFIKQAECLKYNRPVVLNTDHDYENCKYVDDNGDAEADDAVLALLSERMESLREEITNCIKDYLISWFQSITDFWN